MELQSSPVQLLVISANSRLLLHDSVRLNKGIHAATFITRLDNQANIAGACQCIINLMQ